MNGNLFQMGGDCRPTAVIYLDHLADQHARRAAPSARRCRSTVLRLVDLNRAACFMPASQSQFEAVGANHRLEPVIRLSDELSEFQLNRQ